MPRWLKVTLVVALIVALLGAAAVGVGLYVWQRHGRVFVEGGQQSFGEGRAFGRTSNSRGCLTESIERHRRAASFGELFAVNLFLRGCLDVAPPTEGFCDGVPRPFEFTRTAEWGHEQCRTHGLSVERQCGQLFAQVQQYCAARPSGEP